MTAPEITTEGISVQTFAQIFQEYVDGYKAIYGSDINVAVESPDGQRVAIGATLSLDLQLFCVAIANQFDIDLATGQGLKRLLKLAGIYLLPSSRSSVTLTVVTDRDVTMPADYLRGDTIGQNWTPAVETALTTGSNEVTFYAENFGAVEALAGTITEQVTVLTGIVSTTNAAAATAGRNEETEEEVRIRRNRSLEQAAYSTIGSLNAKLLNLTGVVEAVVYENDQDTTDVARDMAPHSIWVVIDGGTLSEIAEVIAKNKTAGTAQKGDEEQTYSETMTRPDGTTFDIVHTVLFDRPTEVPLYIRANVSLKTTGSINQAAIKSAIAEQSYYIAAPAVASELYALGYAAGTNFVLSDLELSLTGAGGWVDTLLEAGFDERFTISTANIALTEV